MASQLLPARTRDHAAVIYAWCRRADDAVDHVEPEDQAPAVARLRAELEGVYGGSMHSDPVLAAFADVVRECGIPKEYPLELVAGMEMDAAGYDYATLEDLLLYCYRVASTVGLMMCHVMGLRRERAVRHAAHLGIAMQLTNICRDVYEDWQMDRLYIPRDVLAEHGLETLGDGLGSVFPGEAREPMAAVVRDLLETADTFYASADRGLISLDFRSALAVRTARKVYAAIGGRLADLDFDVLGGRAVVPTPQKLRLVADAAWQGVLEVPDRVAKTLSGQRVARENLHGVVRFPADVLPI